MAEQIAPRRGIVEEEPAPKPRRWWIPILVLLLVVILAGGGFALWKLLPRTPDPILPPDNAAPELSQVPTFTAGTNALIDVEDKDRYYYSNLAEDPHTPGVGLNYSLADYAEFEATHDSTGWYEGFSEQYAEGLADGQACAAVPQPGFYDYAAWSAYSDHPDTINNFNFPFCTRFVEPPVGDTAKYNDDAAPAYRAGWVDGVGGWIDDVQSTPGLHEAHAPETLEQGSFIIGFALADGHRAWTFKLADTGLTMPTLKPLAYQGTVGPTEPVPNTYIAGNGKGRIAFLVVGLDQTGAPGAALVVLDATTGATIGALPFPDPSAQLLAYVDSTLILNGATGTTALSDMGAPLWSSPDAVPADYKGQAATVIGNQWVFLGEGYASLHDGTPAPFGGDSSASVSYVEANDGLVFRYDSTANTLNLVDPSTNTFAWSSPLPVGSPFTRIHHDVLYTSGTPVGAHYLDTGYSAWAKAVGTPTLSGTVIGIVGRNLIVDSGGDQISALNLDTGEVVTVGTAPQVFLGDETIYLSTPESATASAKKIAEDRVINSWTLTLQEGQHLSLMSGVFVIWGDTGIVRVVS